MPPAPRDLPTWHLLADSLAAGRPAVLLCVTSSRGSSPGRRGFKMAVTATATAGSIGGGIMEHKWVELARRCLATGDFAPRQRPQIHRREAPTDRSGMMCDGEQTVLLLPLRPAQHPTVAAIAAALHTGRRGQLSIAEAGLHVRWAPLGSAAAETDAAVETPAAPVDATPGAAPPATPAAPLPAAYTEPLGFRDHVTIVGAGHVGLALAEVLARLSFEITVLDDRPDLPTLRANRWAHHRPPVPPDYADLPALVPPGPHRYVVVCTVGYRTDALVLKQLLPYHYRYLGVMGSRTKIAELHRTLAEAGFSAAHIGRLRGPIGLPIHSQTPEEIAISIAAELIAARNAG